MKNNGNLQLQNFSNFTAIDVPTGGTGTGGQGGKKVFNKPLISATASTTNAPKPKPSFTTGTRPRPVYMTASIPVTNVVPAEQVIPVIPVPMDTRTLSGGALGGGGGASDSGEEGGKGAVGKNYTMVVSGVSLIAGAVAGYFTAKKYKKNTILGATIGAVSVGALGYYGYTKFVFKKPEEKKSGFAITSGGDFNNWKPTRAGQKFTDANGTVWCWDGYKKYRCNTKSRFVEDSMSYFVTPKPIVQGGNKWCWDAASNQWLSCATSKFVGNPEVLDDLANSGKSNFVTSQSNNPKPKKCWCNTTHGTVQCPCGGGGTAGTH